MIPLHKAQQIVLERATPLGGERVYALDATGRVLVNAVVAQEDQPLFTSSAMDGYAVRSHDTDRACGAVPARLRVGETLRAGDVPRMSLRAGEAIRIMTGAPVPPGADAVVMQERVKRVGEGIAVAQPAVAGENIRFAGEELRRGEEVLTRGTTITPAVVALLEALGYDRVEVLRQPVVSVVTTGDELTAPGQPPRDGMVRDSNTPFLQAALRDMGIGPVVVLPRVADDPERLRAAVRLALEPADCVILTGGVSVGDSDFVKTALADLGVQEHFWQIAVKPGKPTYFGTRGSSLVFGLPGNPVAVGVLFYELVRPALLAMSGHRDVMLATQDVPIERAVRKKTDRMELLRGRLHALDGSLWVNPLSKQDSHMISGFAMADSLICIPRERESIERGELVEVHLLPWSGHGALGRGAIKRRRSRAVERSDRIAARRSPSLSVLSP